MMTAQKYQQRQTEFRELICRGVVGLLALTAICAGIIYITRALGKVWL